jgi:hypothetical protein
MRTSIGDDIYFIYIIPIWAYMTPGLSNDALAISLAIGLGFIGLIATVFLSVSDRLRDFFLESKTGQIDEKIAMVYSYAMIIRSLPDTNRNLMGGASNWKICYRLRTH